MSATCPAHSVLLVGYSRQSRSSEEHLEPKYLVGKILSIWRKSHISLCYVWQYYVRVPNESTLLYNPSFKLNSVTTLCVSFVEHLGSFLTK